jgi:hypothetical protein
MGESRDIAGGLAATFHHLERCRANNLPPRWRWPVVIAALGVFLHGSTFAATLFANSNDCELQWTLLTPPIAVQDLTATTLIAGTAGTAGKERCPVLPFQLPDFGAVTNPFLDASFSCNIASYVNPPVDNANLYGLGRRPEALVLTNDFWAGTNAFDSTDATLLQGNLLLTPPATGVVTSTNAALVNYLNAQYAGGAGAGQFVFLRLSTTAAQSGVARWQITSAEGGVANISFWPQINYTLAPTNPPVDSVHVETRADGAGVVAPATNLSTGMILTNFSIARGSGGVFLSNLPAVWVLTNVTGSVAAQDLVAASDGKTAVFTANAVGSARILAIANATNLIMSGVITVTNAVTNSLYSRPFIWMRSSERAELLAKITTNAWAASLSNSLAARVVADLASYQLNRDTWLRQLPVDWTVSPAKFKTEPTFATAGDLAELKFNDALDCAVLYYLSGDTNYAQLAADVLHNSVKTLLPVAPSTSTGNGGWIIQDDLLYEARQVGTQLAIVYDFLYAYLQTNQVYEVQTAAMVNFNFTNAQEVFRTYYELTRDHGQLESNWSALMSTCMLNNLLALDNAAERAAALQIYLVTGSSRQSSLADDYGNYPAPGDIWPESFQYSSAVGTIRTFHMVLLERYDPALNLFGVYSNLPTSLPRIVQLRYPNPNMQIILGDGNRTDGTNQPFSYYEMIYPHAQARGYTNFASLFGGLLNGGINAGEYNRSTLNSYNNLGPHNELLKLLWSAPGISEPAVAVNFPRTDTLPWAGIALQRNPSTVNNSTYGLMGFIGGAAHVHSHASGMSMELFGLGQVLGSKAGHSTYGSALHENYYRLFSANNTIVVNAGSQGSGGWQGLGINTVQTVAIEPQPFASAVSSNFSFSCSAFTDNMGAFAEATQQRTLAIVRTSLTNGFYVDFFRSKSTVSNRVATSLNGNVTNQFHDYIYHNVGSTNISLTTNGVALPLVAQPSRFQNDIGDAYQQPGWRYFTNTVVSYPHNQPTRVQFNATPASTTLYMDMILPAVTNREYARAAAPPMSEYVNTTAAGPTVVVRQIGDAWDKPFAVVYEPHFNSIGSTVTNVTALWRSNIVVGLKIESLVSGKPRVHYVFSNPNATETYSDASLGLSFKGRFGVAEDKGSNSVALYLGQGSSLTYRGNSVAVTGGTNSAAEVQFNPGQEPISVANAPVNIVTAGAPNFTGITSLGGGAISLQAVGSNGVPYRLWTSTNLAGGAWTILSSGTVTNSPFTMQDIGAATNVTRFYRFTMP